MNDKPSSFLREPPKSFDRAILLWPTMAGAKRRARRNFRVIAALLLDAACIHRRQLITIKRLHPVATASQGAPDIECGVADSVASIRALAHEIPSAFRDTGAELERLVASGNVVCFARRRSDDGGPTEIVGYELAERGIFSALGRRLRVDCDVIFSHWAEVLPAYRGQRIHRALFATRDAYFRERGGALVCGVCRPGNRASLRALRRDGWRVIGAIQRIALFRITLWRTSDAAIERSIRSARRHYRDMVASRPQALQE